MSVESGQKRKDHDAVTPNVGMAWYRREQWDRLLEISGDRDKLEDTYDEGQALAEETLGRLAIHGLVPRKVDIDVEELFSWCHSQHRPVDGKARSEFVAVKLEGGS